MKKVSFFVLSFMFLICFLVGCKAQSTNTQSAVQVPAQSVAQSPNVLVPSIMLDDVLYYLAGESSVAIEIDESDYLGRVISEVPITVWPAENGQANIPVEDAPYAKYGDGIVVLWNGEWQLFKARTEQSENSSDSEAKKQYVADYKGLTKEEYEDLQAQKARFEAMTDEQKQIAREGGTVGCIKFVHLWWEETIEMNFIDYVGSEAFNKWVTEHQDNGDCLNIYSFADEFALDYDTLKSIIEGNHLEEIYPLDRIELRYSYFHESNLTNSKQNSITFPENTDDGETEFNAHIYDIEPFVLSLAIPEGWSLDRWPLAGGYSIITVFSKLNIFNEKKECVGVIGYNIYEPYEGVEDDPRAIYNQIALGNNYKFDVRNSYNVVNEADSGTTAVVDVYYSASINGGVEKNNKGIVSYNKDFLVYIAAEFNADKITDEQLINIAKSIQISRNA